MPPSLTTSQLGELAFVPRNKIKKNSLRVSRDPAEFQSLLESIKQAGIQDPIPCYPMGRDGLHQNMDGDTRLEIAEMLEMELVPIYIVPHPQSADAKKAEVELVKAGVLRNTKRSKFGQLDLGNAYRRWAAVTGGSVAAFVREMLISQSSEDEKIENLSEGAISKSLRILDHIPPEHHQAINSGRFPASTAYEIARLDSGDKTRDQVKRRELIDQVIEKKLTGPKVADLVTEWNRGNSQGNNGNCQTNQVKQRSRNWPLEDGTLTWRPKGETEPKRLLDILLKVFKEVRDELRGKKPKKTSAAKRSRSKPKPTPSSDTISDQHNNAEGSQDDS